MKIKNTFPTNIYIFSRKIFKYSVITKSSTVHTDQIIYKKMYS